MAVTDDKLIVSRMKEDALGGFKLLMDKYKQPVYWHIRRLVVTHADAQDASQEAFVRMYRSFASFNPANSLSAWVYRIATNEALRLIGQRKTTLSLPDGDAPAACSMVADSYTDYSDLEAVRLQKAILSLPRKQQLAFNLRYYDGLSYEEIGQVAGSTAASAKANYHTAKEKIVKYMKEND